MSTAIYARVSGERQQKEQTIGSQVAEVLEFAKRQGLTISQEHHYLDDGQSGFHFERPALDRLRDAARDGLVDMVVIHDPDRLARRYAYQVLLLEEFQRHGVTVRFVRQPPADSPDQQLLLQVQGAIAEYERARIIERTRRGRLFWARQGRPVSGRVPYGYRRFPRNGDTPARVEIEERDATVVRDIFHWYVDENSSMYTIATRLQQRGIPTPKMTTTRWDVSSVGVILGCEAYLGTWWLNRFKREARPGGGRPRNVLRPREQWVGVPIPPLLDPELFARARQARTKAVSVGGGTKPTAHPETHLLRRLVVCGLCNRKMCSLNANASGKVHRYYWCRGPDVHRLNPQRIYCSTPTVRASEIDQVVWDDVCKLLSDPSLVSAAWKEESTVARADVDELVGSNLKRVKAQIAEAEKQRARLLAAYEQGFIELEEFGTRRSQLEQRIKDGQSQVAGMRRHVDELGAHAALSKNINKVCVELGMAIDAMAQPARMRLCQQLIDRVVVKGDKVEIHYRFPVSPPSAREKSKPENADPVPEVAIAERAPEASLATHCNNQRERGGVFLQAARRVPFLLCARDGRRCRPPCGPGASPGSISPMGGGFSV